MIEVKNLSYTYDYPKTSSQKAINNLSFSLNSGEILGIIGKTGSGKSTLTRLLNGLISPSSGKIFLNKKNINTEMKKEIHFKVGVVFQYPEQQLFESTVFEDIAFGARNKGICEKDLAKAVEEAAEAMGIPKKLLGNSPFLLSGGEKRRCALAGVIIMNPEVLILDEPTSGLDFSGKKFLMEFLKKYHEKQKNTIIFISHSMEEIAEISTKILVLDNGESVYFDTPENVFCNYEHLKKIGLDIPQITKITESVRKRGYNLQTPILSVCEGANEISRLLEKGGD